jgi:hypothetical protein
MSDLSPDELASAYVDGEVSADERAQVEGDPELLARVDELRAVQRALAAPVEPPPEAYRDAAIAAALGGATTASVIDLDAARARRRMRLATIAAAIVVVLGVAGVLVRAATDHKATKFEAVSGSVATTTLSPRAEQGAGAATGPAANTGADSIARDDLGSFTDRSSLAAAAQTRVHGQAVDQTKAAASASSFAQASREGAPPYGPGPGQSCPVPPPPDTSYVTYAATAVLGGRPVLVDVFTIADGSLVLVVTDAATCSQVFSQPV